MQKNSFLWMVLAVFVVFTAEGQKLEIGGVAPETSHKMMSVNGEKVSIADVAQENGVLVLFNANTCPFALKWEGRYNELKTYAEKHKVGMIILNSNCQNRGGVDSFDEMKKHASEKGFTSPYVLDAGSKIANAFMGQTTPHAFLLDGKMKLVYKGAIDDNYDDAAKVKNAYVKDAIAALSAGKKVTLAETKPVGCGIKRAQVN